MLNLKQHKKQARILPKLWPILLVVSLAVSSIGSAHAQTAEADSISTAFFLLKFDYDLLKAKTEGVAQLDSLRFSQMQDFLNMRIEDEKAIRNRGYVMIAVSVVLSGAMLYLGGVLAK